MGTAVVMMVVSRAARKSARHRALMIRMFSDLVRPASGSLAPGPPGDGLLPAGVVSAPSGPVSVVVGLLEAPSRSTSRVLSELVLSSGTGAGVGVDVEAAIVDGKALQGLSLASTSGDEVKSRRRSY